MNESNSEARYVLWPDPNPDANGYRACAVTENEFGYRQPGKISNNPSDMPPLYIGTTEDEAKRFCYAWNKSHFGYSKEVQDKIVLSAMRPGKLKATYDGDSDRYTVLRDGDEALSLSSDECEDMVRQLYRLRWAYGEPECPVCGEPLERFECVNEDCPECPDHELDADDAQ